MLRKYKIWKNLQEIKLDTASNFFPKVVNKDIENLKEKFLKM